MDEMRSSAFCSYALQRSILFAEAERLQHCVQEFALHSAQEAAERARLLPETVGVPLHAGRNKVVFHFRQKMIQWMDCW